jgi:hypothetical protein
MADCNENNSKKEEENSNMEVVTTSQRVEGTENITTQEIAIDSTGTTTQTNQSPAQEKNNTSNQSSSSSSTPIPSRNTQNVTLRTVEQRKPSKKRAAAEEIQPLLMSQILAQETSNKTKTNLLNKANIRINKQQLNDIDITTNNTTTITITRTTTTQQHLNQKLKMQRK